MWIKIAGTLLRYRVVSIITVFCITLFMGFHATDVQMSYEAADLLPPTDSAYIEYTNFRSVFGREENVMVFAIQDSNFYELEKINDFIKLGKDIKAIDGVTTYMSITNAYNLTKNTYEQKFEIESLFGDSVSSKTELDSIARVAESLPFYDEMLINKETHAYSAMISLSSDVMNSPARVALVDEILKLTNDFSAKHQLKIHYSGMPYIRVVNAENVKFEMFLFIALSLLITAVILYIFFRSFRIVWFCVFIIALSVVWAIGFMSIFETKITLLTAMLPPLIIVIGIPNCVYMINMYHSEYVRHHNKILGLQRMIYKVGNASLLSNLTTAAGFATFVITSSRILIEFGFISFLSIASVFIICLVLIPAIFSFLPPPEPKQTKHLFNPYITELIEKITSLVVNKRKIIFSISAVLLCVSFIGIYYMKTTGYMVDDLKESDPIRQDLAFFENNFGGLMPLEISIDFNKPRQILELSNLQKIDKLDKELIKDDELSNSLSLLNVVKFANQAYYNGKESYYKLPTAFNKNFIMRYAANSLDGKGNITNAYVDSTMQKMRLSYRVKDIGTKKMEEKEASIFNKVNEIFPKDKYKTQVTGSSIIFFRGNKYLISNLFTSLALAILLIAGFMAWIFRSKRMVLIALLPNIIPQIITAAIMGYAGIPIKSSTILVFSVAFGISVDNTIHYLAKYKQELQSTNWRIYSSVILALKEVGQSMIYTSIILFFGFSIFCLSSFGGTFALGLLTSITLFSAMIANTVLLPSFLLTMERKTTVDTFNAESYIELFEEEDIDPNKLEKK